MKHNHSHDDHHHDHDVASQQSSSSKVINAEVSASSQTVLLVAGVDCSEEVAAIESALKDTGHTSLWLAILADTRATLLVVTNALKLLSPKKTIKQ